MTTTGIKFSKSVYWISALVLLTVSKVWAEDDIPPIHDPLHAIDRLVSFFRDLWQLLQVYFG